LAASNTACTADRSNKCHEYVQLIISTHSKSIQQYWQIGIIIPDWTGFGHLTPPRKYLRQQSDARLEEHAAWLLDTIPFADPTIHHDPCTQFYHLGLCGFKTIYPKGLLPWILMDLFIDDMS